MSSPENTQVCGHMATNGGWVFTCDLPPDHQSLHRQKTNLRDRVEFTNWGDDGKAAWATSDPRRHGRV